MECPSPKNPVQARSAATYTAPGKRGGGRRRIGERFFEGSVSEPTRNGNAPADRRATSSQGGPSLKTRGGKHKADRPQRMAHARRLVGKKLGGLIKNRRKDQAEGVWWAKWCNYRNHRRAKKSYELTPRRGGFSGGIRKEQRVKKNAGAGMTAIKVNFVKIEPERSSCARKRNLQVPPKQKNSRWKNRGVCL